jgi:tetratricopeptide (TPR) repeat protein
MDPAREFLALGEDRRHITMTTLGRTLTLLLIACGAALAFLPGCATHQPGPSVREKTLDEAMSYAQSAEDADKAKNYDKAVELNKKALALHPELGGVWNNLGLALMHRGLPNDFVEASQAFKQAADTLPTDDRPYQNLGVLYHERGFSDEALRYFALALDRNPNSLDSIRGAVGSAKRLGKSDEAGLARLNRGLMIETDPQWRQIMEFEKLRVQNDLAERARPST